MVTAVKVRNTADKPGDADQGWEAEIAVPLAAVKGRAENMAVQIPPKVGDRWHLNVVRVDTRSGGGNPSASSWNRIGYSDFHALDRMLTVVFADRTGTITPQPPTQPPPAPGSAGSAAGPAPTGTVQGVVIPPAPRNAGSAGPAPTGTVQGVVVPAPRSAGSAATPPAAGAARGIGPPAAAGSAGTAAPGSAHSTVPTLRPRIPASGSAAPVPAAPPGVPKTP
jgi:hypothetical protein